MSLQAKIMHNLVLKINKNILQPWVVVYDVKYKPSSIMVCTVFFSAILQNRVTSLIIELPISLFRKTFSYEIFLNLLCK
jgi:hypothetical protein